MVLGCQIGGSLISALLLWLLAGIGYGWADAVAGDGDVGMSAGALGAAAAYSELITPVWRIRLRLGLCTYVVVMLLFSGAIYDLEHFWGVAIGLVAGEYLAGRRLQLPRPRFLTVREARALVAYLIVLNAFISIIVLVLPGNGGVLGSGRAYEGFDLGVTDVVSSLLLLLLADGLRRGRRIAWLLTLILITPAYISVLTGPARPDTVVLAVFASFLYLVMLAHWHAFAVLPTWERMWPLLLRVLVAAALLCAYVAVGFSVLAGSFTPAATVSSSVRTAVDRLLLEGASALTARTPIAALFLGSISVLGVLLVVVAVGALFLSSRRATRTATHDQAMALLVRYGGGNQSWMTTWPGNTYWITEDGQAYVAYRVIGNVALVLGDPVGSDVSRRDAVAEFGGWAHRRGWSAAFFGASSEILGTYRQQGWQTVQVGEDTVVGLEHLEFRGKAWQDIRTAINTAAKQQIGFEFVDLTTAPASITDQLERISAEWVGDKGLPEMGFTLGSLVEARDPNVRTAVAVDSNRTVHGVTTWLPVYRDGAVGGWTIDVMRRRGSGFRGVMEFLIAQAALAFRDEGYPFLSLSDAPLARLPREGEELQSLQRALDLLADAMEPYYGFRSLLAFKAKFQPSYHPAYLIYPDALALPSIGLAIIRAYLPGLGIRDATRILQDALRPGRR